MLLEKLCCFSACGVRGVEKEGKLVVKHLFEKLCTFSVYVV